MKLRILFTALLAFGLTISCEDGENVFDEIIANEQRGAILRTINVISDEIPIGNDDSFFGVELEVQDQENGALVSAIDVFVGFRDNTVAEGETDLDTDEVLAATLDASTFEIGEFGLPRTSYEITLPELVAALPISNSDVDGSDQFTIRFELVLVDGRRFSNDDNTGTLTGSFFSSPFLYTAIVVCPPRAPSPGVWTIEMQDSYEDGWQTTTSGGGPGITVTLNDGTVLEVGLCSPYGSAAGTFLGGPDCTPTPGASGTGTITIPDGTETADWFFPGDFWGEISFQIITPNGNTVADVAAGAEAGPIVIDFCKD